MTASSAPGRILTIAGEPYRYFGGTAYLGLPVHAGFQQLVVKNLNIWGTAFGSSRHSNVQLGAYEAGEKFLACLTGADAVLTVSSGMLAGKLVMETLSKTTDQFFHFPGAHPAILVPGSLPVFEKGLLHPNLCNNKPESVTLVTDGIPAGQVTPISLDVIAQIAPQKNITLVLDESHSLGIAGERGGGIFQTIHLPNVSQKIMVASLGKALGLTGGMIAGDARFIAKLNALDAYIAAAGMPPAFAQTLADAKEIIEEQQQQLKENLQYLHTILSPAAPVTFNSNYPLLYPKHETMYEALKAAKIIITHFQYADGALNRIVISAHHTREDLERLAAILNTNNDPH